MDVDHPGLNLTRNMMRASQLRMTIYEWLSDRRVKQFHKFRMVVDYATLPDDLSVYSFCLRVYQHGSKVPLLTKWSETEEGLVCDENMALLLVLYNS